MSKISFLNYFHFPVGDSLQLIHLDIFYWYSNERPSLTMCVSQSKCVSVTWQLTFTVSKCLRLARQKSSQWFLLVLHSAVTPGLWVIWQHCIQGHKPATIQYFRTRQTKANSKSPVLVTTFNVSNHFLSFPNWNLDKTSIVMKLEKFTFHCYVSFRLLLPAQW